MVPELFTALAITCLRFVIEPFPMVIWATPSNLAPQVMLYSEPNFQGTCRVCMQDLEILPETIKIMSCRVQGGRWGCAGVDREVEEVLSRRGQGGAEQERKWKLECREGFCWVSERLIALLFWLVFVCFSWAFYEDHKYSGNTYVLSEGDYPNLTSMGCPPCSLGSLKSIPMVSTLNILPPAGHPMFHILSKIIWITLTDGCLFLLLRCSQSPPSPSLAWSLLRGGSLP